jgi:hypothetical protein
VKDHHAFTCVLWSQKLGRIGHCGDQEQDWYRNQLLPLCRNFGEKPQLMGNFTDWLPSEMQDLFDFLVENDPN